MNLKLVLHIRIHVDCVKTKDIGRNIVEYLSAKRSNTSNNKKTSNNKYNSKYNKQHTVDVNDRKYDCQDESKSSCGFYAMHISNLALKPAISNEAFTTVNVQYSNPRVSGPLHLKIDTGSGGNTIPMRTYHSNVWKSSNSFYLDSGN